MNRHVACPRSRATRTHGGVMVAAALCTHARELTVLPCFSQLNLLIAMMSSTYDRFRSDSTLLYRKQFAHLVLRLELESKFLTRPTCGLWKPWIQNAGEVTGEKDGKPVYSFLFKDVAANREGFGLVSSVFLDTSSGDLTCVV